MTDSPSSARPTHFYGASALRARPLKLAVTLPGLEHPAFRDVLAAAMPGVRHFRTAWPDGQAEHSLIDSDAGSALRITIAWDPRRRRARTRIAEIGPRSLWDELVIHLTEWQHNSRTIPACWPGAAE